MAVPSSAKKRSIWKDKAHDQRKTPLWKGPLVDGVTQSLISLFLLDPHRFYLKTILGLDRVKQFNHRIAYGHFWHAGMDALNSGKSFEAGISKEVEKYLTAYPTEVEAIRYWASICRTQLEEYVSSCKADEYKSVEVEKEFRIQYPGAPILIRGKIDLIYQNRLNQFGVKDYKTKGAVDIQKISRQFKFDLQIMVYVVAANLLGYDIRESTYDVIRRPLSGGKHSIVRHKPSKSNPRGESKGEFLKRLQTLICNNPDDFFWKIKQSVTSADINRFRVQCLTPILLRICEWWEFMRSIDFGFEGEDIWGTRHHCRYPFGMYPLDDSSDEIDEYLATGSMVGLQRIDNLFPEMAEVEA